VLTFPLRGFSIFTLGGANIRVSDLVLVLITAAFLGLLLLERRRIFLSRIFILLGAWVLLNGLSILWSSNVDLAILRAVSLLRELLVFYLLSDWLLADFEARGKLLSRVMYVTAVMLIIGIVVGIWRGGLSALSNLAATQDLLTTNNALLTAFRTRSTASDIFLSGSDAWLMTCLAVIIGFKGLTVKSTPQGELGYYSLILAILAGIVIYFRRTTIIGLAIYFAIILFGQIWLNRPRARTGSRYILPLLILGLGLYLSGFGKVVVERFASVTILAEQSIMIRLNFFKVAVDNFMNSPILGIGSGNALGYQEIVHNLFLQVAAETGIIGLVLFLSAFIVALRYLWRLQALFRQRNQIAYYSLVVSILAAIVSYLVVSLASNDFETPDPWMLLAITSVMWVWYGGNQKMKIKEVSD
jgi:O-antigen ligase